MMRASFIVAMLLTCVGPWAHGAEQGRAAESAVLSLWNRPIVTFRATVDGTTPEQRVRNSHIRIEEHFKVEIDAPVGTRAAEIGPMKGVLVTLGPNVAFGLVEEDRDPESSLTLDQTAAHAAARLREALQAREQQQRPTVIARGIGLTLLAIPVFLLALKLIFWAREVAIRKLDQLLRLRRWVIGGVDIIPTLATVERATFRVLAWAAIGAVTYLFVTFVLQAFPYTEPLGDELGQYLRGHLASALLGALRSTPSIFAIAAVILITRAIALWIARLLAEVEQGARTTTWLAREQARATRRIASGLVWVLGLAVAYSLLPWSNSPIFRGMSLVIGLGASLASAGLVNQWISGLVVLYSRSYRIGDYVRIGEIEGTVAEMGSLATKIRTMRREEVTVPNAVMTSDKLINFTRLGGKHGQLLSVSVAIGYGVPWRRVDALLMQAAMGTDGVRHDPPPSVLRWELSDFNIQYLVHVHLEHAEQRFVVRSALNSNILDAFTAAGIQIMTPHFESQPEKPVIADPASLPS